MTIQNKLDELGIVLPKPAAPVASYVPFVISGNCIYISGQLPFDATVRSSKAAWVPT